MKKTSDAYRHRLASAKKLRGLSVGPQAQSLYAQPTLPENSQSMLTRKVQVTDDVNDAVIMQSQIGDSFSINEKFDEVTRPENAERYANKTRGIGVGGIIDYVIPAIQNEILLMNEIFFQFDCEIAPGGEKDRKTQPPIDASQLYNNTGNPPSVRPDYLNLPFNAKRYKYGNNFWDNIFQSFEIQIGNTTVFNLTDGYVVPQSLSQILRKLPWMEPYTAKYLEQTALQGTNVDDFEFPWTIYDQYAGGYGGPRNQSRTRMFIRPPCMLFYLPIALPIGTALKLRVQYRKNAAIVPDSSNTPFFFNQFNDEQRRKQIPLGYQCNNVIAENDSVVSRKITFPVTPPNNSVTGVGNNTEASWTQEYPVASNKASVKTQEVPKPFSDWFASYKPYIDGTVNIFSTPFVTRTYNTLSFVIYDAEVVCARRTLGGDKIEQRLMLSQQRMTNTSLTNQLPALRMFLWQATNSIKYESLSGFGTANFDVRTDSTDANALCFNRSTAANKSSLGLNNSGRGLEKEINLEIQGTLAPFYWIYVSAKGCIGPMSVQEDDVANRTKYAVIDCNNFLPILPVYIKINGKVIYLQRETNVNVLKANFQTYYKQYQDKVHGHLSSFTAGEFKTGQQLLANSRNAGYRADNECLIFTSQFWDTTNIPPLQSGRLDVGVIIGPEVTIDCKTLANNSPPPDAKNQPGTAYWATSGSNTFLCSDVPDNSIDVISCQTLNTDALVANCWPYKDARINVVPITHSVINVSQNQLTITNMDTMPSTINPNDALASSFSNNFSSLI